MGDDFQWPWQYNFPPFFTIQPNLDTRAKQIEAWTDLILSYYKHHKLYRLDITEAQADPLFNNSAISRKLSMGDIIKILDMLAKSGHVEWDDVREKKQCYLMWRNPNEWADMIYSWVSANGMTDTVCTLFELHSGDDTNDEEFHGIDINVLRKALQVLERRGKAQIFSAENPQEEGVKFFS